MTNEQKSTLKWVEAYKNPIQLDIIIYLLIYKKMSLTDLCSKLKKSKPTISKHTKELISLYINEEDEKSEFEGRIPTKYYSLKIIPEGGREIELNTIEDVEKLEKALLDIRDVEITVTNLISRFNSFLNEFFYSEKSRILNFHKNLSLLQKKSIESKPYLHVSFISDKYINEFNKERELFDKKMRDLSRKSFNDGNDKMNNVYCEVFFNFDQISND